MKISILNFDLSNNSLGRAYILAKMLSKKYEVEILGPKFDKTIWSPIISDKSIKYVILSKSLKDIKTTLNQINGDIIYAVKPYGTSFGYALLKKFLNRIPIIFDEDDWDFGFFLDNSQSNFLIELLYVNLLDINNPLYTYILGKLSFLANEKTVSTTFLQKKFGGTIIPHARDKKMFIVNKSEVEKVKNKYNPNNKKVIMFYGTVRKHKGLDLIISAIDLLNRNDIIFIIVGVTDSDRNMLPNRAFIKTIPPQNFENLANILDLATLVVLPQKKSYSSLGQIPAKLFDAMAMGKPVIASNISDFPIILKDCGLIFETDNVTDLAKKIKYLFDYPKIADQMGRKAREKFIKNYSFEAVENKLLTIIETISKK